MHSVGSWFTYRRPATLTGLAIMLAVTGCSRSGPSGAARTVPASYPSPTAAPTATTSTAAPAPTTIATAESVTTQATTTSAPPTTKPPGPPFALASTTLKLVDTSRPTVSRGQTLSASRALTTQVWYPAASGRWPLLVFAHGYDVGPETYLHLCQVWAAAGFVVAAPEFPLTDPAVAGAALDEGDIAQQPGDVRFVITTLLTPSGPLAGHIDQGRIGVAGHSDGGETALAIGFLPGQSDWRVKAVMAFSVQVVPGETAQPGRPLLVAQGDRDTINPPALGQAVYDQAASPRWLLRLAGAGHLPPFAGGSVWQPVVDRVTVDFLNRYVAGTGSTAALAADGQGPGLASIVGAP
jgi:dienelactone hydrolase